MRTPTIGRNDLENVKQLPILDVAGRLGIVVRSGRSARCPFPGHADARPSFAFYPGTNSCWCHGCGRGGDVINLVALNRDLSPGEAIRWLRENYGLRSDSFGGRGRQSARPTHIPAERAPTREQTSGFTANVEIYEALLAAHPIAGDAAAYLTLRGFSKATVAHFRLGFLSDGRSAARALIKRFGRDAVYHAGLLSGNGEGARFLLPSPSVLFPFVEGGRIVYVQSRILPGATGPRWMGPRGVPKPVYNVDVIARSTSIYVCEGATDVVSAHELKLSAIGLLGGASRLPQVVLSALKGRTVYIVPDGDDVGSQMSTKLTSDLRGVGIQSVIKPLSMGKDINEFLLLSRHRT